VPAYVDEGVDPSRGTETFAEGVLSIDTPRWHGVPFVLCAGRALAARRKEAVVRLRASDVSSSLRVGIDGPSDIALELAGQDAISLIGAAPASDVPPYGAVLLELLEGGSGLSVRGDEAEEAWRVVELVLTAWRERRPRRTPPDRPGRRGGQRRRICGGASDSDPLHGREPRVGGVASRAAG